MCKMSLKTSILAIIVVGVYLSTVMSVPAHPDPRIYKQVVIEGHNMQLQCNFSSIPGIDLYWTKDTGGSTFHQDGILLKIDDIRRNASGKYFCHANKRDGDTWTIEIVTVEVQYPAEVKMWPVSKVIHENETFSVKCAFDAKPNSAFYFNQENAGGVIADFNRSIDRGSIQIGPSRATCKDSGFYKCTAYNYLNNGVNSTATSNITVLCKPQHDPQAGGRFHTRRVILGESGVYFESNFVANPAPAITWDHEGTVLPPNMQNNTHDETILTLPNITVEDYGNYSVTIRNEFGTYTESYVLEPQVWTPQRPKDLRFSTVTYTSVTLEWTSGFDQGSPQYFVVLSADTRQQLSPHIPDTSDNHGVGQNWTYTVTNLTGNTFYRLTVYSENQHHYYSGDAKLVQFFTKFGIPQQPMNLEFYNVTCDSVTLQWTSGFDMGSRQYFVVVTEDTRVKLSPEIPDTSDNHGIGQNWTYTATGLAGNTDYRLTVFSIFSKNVHKLQSSDAISVEFRTEGSPTTPAPQSGGSKVNVGGAVGGTLGGLVVIGLVVFAVYFFKYRNRRLY